MSQSKIGVHHSEETKRKISKFHLGKKRSDNAKINMINASKGKILSKNHKTKLSDLRIGKKLSEKTKNKMSESRKGEKNHKNKYHYFCSDNKDYWKDFTKNERIHICLNFRVQNKDTIIYKNIKITRELKI